MERFHGKARQKEEKVNTEGESLYRRIYPLLELSKGCKAGWLLP
jgi:hypothetical protein